MDRTKVSGTLDVGSIPAGASSSRAVLRYKNLISCIFQHMQHRTTHDRHAGFVTTKKRRDSVLFELGRKFSVPDGVFSFG